ncbi:unnamed protein product [Ceratitis capitata]|uniref:U6 snRNA-associated Sm-like protein LSm2 n=3 Tax=Dacinae TaxID=164860 RepID=A0A811UVM7_CERCA|nr:unnamed protein product [Ceratitis capitata]
MLFYSFFKSLVGKDVVVELKNDLSICGTLHSVDQYLNIKLTDINVTDPALVIVMRPALDALFLLNLEATHHAQQLVNFYIVDHDTAWQHTLKSIKTNTGNARSPSGRAVSCFIALSVQIIEVLLESAKHIYNMLFYSFFKSLVGKDVVVELKNDLSICGTLHSVDQYLNIKLTDINVTDPDKYPHMLSVKNCFIRGSVVRYVQLPGDEVDTQLLQDAARKEAVVSTR